MPDPIKDIYTVDSAVTEFVKGFPVTRLKLVAPKRTSPQPDVYVDIYVLSGGAFDAQPGDQFDVSITPRRS